VINVPLAIVSASLVLLLPGAVWLAWRPTAEGDGLGQLADGIGLSLALSALAALVFFFAGVHLRVSEVRVAYVLCLLLAAAGWLRRQYRAKAPVALSWRAFLGLGVGALGVLAVLLWRFFQARGLIFPAWVDSVHHVLIVNKILALGGLPETLAPEVNVFFSYHYAFHWLTALFARLSGMASPQAVLWLGQVLNGLVALSVYRLGLALWGERRRAALAGLLVGFAFQMPAYYLAWGRYTLLTGLLLLPLAMAAALDLLRQPSSREAFLRLAVLTAGLALSHYMALYLFALFLLVLALSGLWGVWRAPRRERLWPWLGLGLAVALGIALAFPWLYRVLWHQGAQAAVRLVSPLDASQMGYLQYILSLAGPLHNHVLFILAAAGAGYALLEERARPLALWGFLLALLMLPWGVRLGPFRPDHMAIVLFLPAALCLAHGLVGGAEVLYARFTRPEWRRGVVALALGAALGLLGWGAWQTRNVTNPVTQLVTPADVQALDWVRANLPAEARFLINVVPWQGSTYRGVDGGYWLIPYAGRQSLLPPVIYAWGPAQEVARINRWAEQAAQLKTCDAAFWALVDEAGLNYIYVREGQGSLTPQALNQCQGVVPVYRRDGVYIYAVERQLSNQ